jgi:hypothetical protein
MNLLGITGKDKNKNQKISTAAARVEISVRYKISEKLIRPVNFSVRYKIIGLQVIFRKIQKAPRGNPWG